jgi:hypothetical protein
MKALELKSKKYKKFIYFTIYSNADTLKETTPIQGGILKFYLSNHSTQRYIVLSYRLSQAIIPKPKLTSFGEFTLFEPTIRAVCRNFSFWFKYFSNATTEEMLIKMSNSVG